MESILKTLIEEPPIEHIALDEKLCVIHFSERAPSYADDPSMLFAGEDIRAAFPEFVGIENDLRQIASSKQGKWQIRNLSRVPNNAFTVDITVQPSPIESKEKLIVLIEDVTERTVLTQMLVQQSNENKLLLTAVAATRDHYEEIIESISDGLLVLTMGGSLRTANAAASRLLGYHKAELVGMVISDFLNIDITSLEGQPLRDFETIVTTKTSEKAPVSILSSVIETDVIAPKNILLLIRDLREKKLAEIHINKLETENAYLLEEIQTYSNFHEIIGNSRAIKKLFKQIEQVAGTDSTVLLLGETGTGKELISRAIHNLSQRSKGLLVQVNCAALPSELVESELFGHEKGAFTGANERRIGRFERASGGTIVLDEIGELPLGTQAKLLRVLQEREFERVGGTQTHVSDVRVIASTNRNLEEAIETGAFRSDLFFRLNVFPIQVPPLRERKEDIHLLVKFFVQQFSRRMNKKIRTIEKKSMDNLLKYDWPGNVRELSAIVERAVIISESDVLSINFIAHGGGKGSRKMYDGTLEEVEREHILQVLKDVEDVIEGPKGAALRLGINPSTLRSRMRKLGIHRRGSGYR